MQSSVALSAASLAVRVIAKCSRMDPIRAKKYALAGASLAVRVASSAWLPVAILGAQVAVVTMSSASATVYARVALDYGEHALETMKSLPALANHSVSIVSKRLLSEPQHDTTSERRPGEDVRLIVAQHAAFERRRQAAESVDTESQAVALDMCTA